MHPLGLYLVHTTNQRRDGWAGPGQPRMEFAAVDASPSDPAEVVMSRSRIGRLAVLVRRLVVRTAGA